MSGGWEEVYRHNHAPALVAHQLLVDALNVEPRAPTSMLDAMAAVTLPRSATEGAKAAAEAEAWAHAIYDALRKERFEVPVMVAPDGSVVVRISAQLYNQRRQYERLAIVLARLCEP